MATMTAPVSFLARTCKVTGLVVDRSAERQIMAHAVTAVVWLAVGGILALLIALTRWQAVHLLPADLFYAFLSAHGMVMLIFWIIFFEIAGLIFASTVLLSSKMVWPAFGWIAYGMMLIGSIISFWLMISGEAVVMFTSYPPLAAPPLYYASVLVFAVGAILGCVHFFINVVAARLRGLVKTLPLFTFALMAAALLALWSLFSGAAALIPVFFWSIGMVPHVDPGAYRLLYWGLGHGAQQVNLAAMVGIWYGLATLTTGAKPLNEGLSRFAIVLYIFFIQLGSMHHLQVDPGFNTWVRNINVSYFMYAAVMGSLIHAFSIPASVERAMRDQGFRNGLFSWLRHAPWGEPGFSALIISLAMFGIIGGISGVILGGPQLNMIAHNTMTVPAHFHMTVVAGTTIAFMGISYYLVPLIFRRELMLRSWAKAQPYVYGAGMGLWALGMGLTGHWGVPRRHWDISFAAVPEGLRYNMLSLPEVNLFLGVLGIGAILAVTGGAMFVLPIVLTVFLGKRTDTPSLGKVSAVAFGPATPDPEEPHHGGFEVPGTLVLTISFLALFVFLYGFSWFELSSIPWTIYIPSP
ncbi:MAG: cbb3-type cytochrome c oxidase subunit I [Dehalococcoidia bacterium]